MLSNIRPTWVCIPFVCLLTLPAMPQSRVFVPDPLLHMTLGDLSDSLNSGAVSLNQVRRAGLEVFTRPLTTVQGYGDGPFRPSESPPTAPGNRPTLQGNGTSLRVNGLDAQSCNECHSIVSHDTVPPKLGIGGVGGLAQNAFIGPTEVDVSDDWHTASGRDGSADFNGRFSNPPFLFGGGGVELLAKEMTADLQDLLKQARSASPGTITALHSKGVHFGFLRTEEGGVVSLDHLDGIGFKDNDGKRAEDVLVVRPFGRKGEKFSMRDFGRDAMAFHFGIQPTEVVGRNTDGDGDGIANEMSEAAMTALQVFSVTNPPPIMETMDQEADAGFRIFTEIGCSGCHRPVMTTRSRYLPIAHPEVPHDPSANVYALIDLVDVGFAPAPTGGVYVPLFGDLKRHAMGPGLAENSLHDPIPNDEFTTARLWGVRDTAPYLHDGRALDIRSAILAHGDKAAKSRDLFLNLKQQDQVRLIHFLRGLRTPDDPNAELVEPVAE